eukprot:COSAG01_NODE_4798_length_4738_cov_3.104980_2_plen_305_part_00
MQAQLFFGAWREACHQDSGRLMAIVLQWKEVKAQQMLNRCLFQGWKRVVKEERLAAVQGAYSTLQSSAAEETETLREMCAHSAHTHTASRSRALARDAVPMRCAGAQTGRRHPLCLSLVRRCRLGKSKSRLAVAQSIGEDRVLQLSRLAGHFKRPWALEGLAQRRRGSVEALSSDVRQLGLMDAELEEALQVRRAHACVRYSCTVAAPVVGACVNVCACVRGASQGVLSSIDARERAQQLQGVAEADAAAAAAAAERRRLEMAAQRDHATEAAEAARRAALAAPSQRAAAVQAGDTYVTRRVVR